MELKMYRFGLTKERYIMAQAILDTGLRGIDANANIISAKFLQKDLRDQFEPFPPGQEHSFTGLGRNGNANGTVELKFQGLYKDEQGVLRKGDVQYETFYVYDGPSFPGDMLFGLEFCRKREVFRFQPF
jgi:hypothetical protein